MVVKKILETEKNKILRPASGNIPRHGWYRFTSETEPARASQPTLAEVGQFQIWCTWLKSGFGQFLAIMDHSLGAPNLKLDNFVCVRLGGACGLGWPYKWI